MLIVLQKKRSSLTRNERFSIVFIDLNLHVDEFFHGI